jgi:hypothetical protein
VPTLTQRTRVSTIRFAATLYTIDNWNILRLPEEASQRLPSRGQVAVRGTVNGHEFQTVLVLVQGLLIMSWQHLVRTVRRVVLELGHESVRHHAGCMWMR